MNKYNLRFFVIFLLFTSSSFATVEWTTDTTLVPFGFEENYLASTGAALEGSPGNAITNPAAHVFKRSANDFTVSGFQVSSLKYAESEENDEDATRPDSPIDVKPGMSAMQFSTDNHSTVLYLFTPIDFLLKTEDYIDNKKLMQYTIKFSTLHIGTSYALKIRDNFSLGMNLELSKQVAELNGSWAEKITEDETSYTYFTNLNSISEAYYLTPYLGAYYRPWAWYQLGLKTKIPSYEIKTKGQYTSTYYFSLSDTIERQELSFHPSITTPLILTFGQSFVPSSKFRLLIDLSYGFSQHYASEGENGAYEASEAATLRMQVGSISSLTNQLDLLLGFSNYRRRNNTDWQTENQSYSGGFVFKQRLWHFAAGVFYDHFPGQTAVEFYGLNFSTKYLL